MPRILHLSRSDFANASGRSALALHRQLRAAGLDSRLLVEHSVSREEGVTEWFGEPASIDSAPPSSFAVIQRLEFDRNAAHPLASSFTLGYPGRELPADALREADVVHLHDVRGMFAPPVLAALLRSGPRVVWTLYDAWPFTGGCHAPAACQRFGESCRPCPQLREDRHGLPGVLLDDKRAWLGGPGLTAVATTAWLAQRAGAGVVSAGWEIMHLPPLSAPLPEIPGGREAARAALGLPPTAFTLLMVGESDLERRAQSIEHLGAEFAAYHSLHRLHRAGQLTLLIMGPASIAASASSPPLRCIAPHHATELASLLTAADLVVLPRMEENSPHLAAEAFRCGSPLVAFDTGGLAELVTDGQTGALVPCGDGRRMAETISHLALHRDQLAEWSANCRVAAARLPAPSTVAGEYRALYERLLARPAAAPAAPVPPELRPSLRAACWQALQPPSLDGDRIDRTTLDALRAEVAQLTSLLHLSRQKLAMFMRKLANPTHLAAQSVTISSEKLRGRLTRILLESELDAASRQGAHFPRFDDHRNGAPLQDRDSRLFRWLCLRLLKHPANIRLGRFEHYPPRPLVPERFPRARLRAKKLPSIAIVTPSYMQGGFIAQTIESVVSQAYPKLAYTVQDGGSTDGTTGVLRRFGPQLSSWTSHPDTGQSRAVLAGFRKVRGDIMAYLNSDDLLMPGALRYVGEFFRRHPQVDAIYGHRVVIDEQGREVGRWVLPPHDPEILRWVDYVPQETLFWRSQIYEQIGGIDAKFRFALDWDLLLRLEEAGAKIVRVPYFLGCFRVHGQQKTSAQQNVGLEEMTFLRRRTHGRPPRAGELSQAHSVIGRRAAFYAHLLRWGIRL